MEFFGMFYNQMSKPMKLTFILGATASISGLYIKALSSYSQLHNKQPVEEIIKEIDNSTYKNRVYYATEPIHIPILNKNSNNSSNNNNNNSSNINIKY